MADHLQIYRQARSLPELFFTSVEGRRPQPFLWTKVDGRYQSESWGKIERDIVNLAKALVDMGVTTGDRVALISENRSQWLVSDLAIMTAGGVTVPSYTTNTTLEHLHVITNSGAVGLIVSTRALAEKVLPAAIEAPSVKFMICMEPIMIQQKHTIDIQAFDAVLAHGARLEGEVKDMLAKLKREALATIIYTSGTGGTPKGVMLAHGAILSNCMGAHDVLAQGWTLGEEAFLSFLPLSHAYERMGGQFFPIALGAQIYYAESIDKLVDNLGEAKPTIMTAVPRLFEVMRLRLMRALKDMSPLRQRLFQLAVDLGTKKAKGAPLSFGERLKDVVAEKLIRQGRVKQRFGGRLKALVSGGAALNAQVGLYFKAIGVEILQGYGQTEAAPLISVNRRQNPTLGSVGPPVKDVEVQIADDGEILVRGELVMMGYWQNEEATEAAISKEGWLHTGDIGALDSEGRIVITDRKKDIIVLSGGDNVSPARIEGFLTLEPEIGQAMVHGDKQPHVIALLVPDPDFLAEWKQQTGKAGALKDLADDPDLYKVLGAAVARVNGGLSNLERVRKFLIADQEFTTDNALMTPSMKIRRHKILGLYGEELNKLFPEKKKS